MVELTAAVRLLLAATSAEAMRMELSPRSFAVVLTEMGPRTDSVLRLLDGLQPGGCGPVLDDPDRSFRYWIVPHRTCQWWTYELGICIGEGTVALPPFHRREPPGPYWIRPWRRTHLVGPAMLQYALNEARPTPAHRLLLPG